jgi:hypothetical protein
MAHDFKLVAKRPVLVGDPARDNANLLVESGEVVPFCKNWEGLEAIGYVDRVYELDSRRKAKPAIPAKLGDMGKDELRDLLDDLGVPPHSLIGTGSKGYVIKPDLIAAIEAQR